jgi:hypothetical protein
VKEFIMRASIDLTRIYGPRRRKHYSDNANLDEPGRLVDQETMEIEHELPTDENEPVEEIPAEHAPEPSVFED